MRVLHVYKTYYPDTLGGVEQVLFQLTSALADQGVDNRLFVLSPDARPSVIERPEASIIRCQYTLQMASTPVSWRALSAFRAQLQWADVVHYQFPWPFADLLHFMSGAPRPSVVTYQSDVVRQKLLLEAYRPLMLRFLTSVGRVVTTSPNYLATSPVLSALRRSVEVIPNGLNAGSQSKASAEKLAHWRQRLGDGFFFFVGVLRYYKGLHTLVEAARHVNRSIVIAGDGPEYRALAAQAATLGVGHVKFIGEVSEEDKSALFQLALAFVFPSHVRSEAFGMSLVEAASYGLPMVSCEIGTGTTFINLHGETGFSVPPEDSVALAGAMGRLLSEPAEVLRMGQAARLRYEQFFTADEMASRYLALYSEIAGQ
jgi:glycosyltransferase involved in cell wall biosynthesis